MKKNNRSENAQKNNINDIKEEINNNLLNLINYNLYKTNIGCFYENSKINSNLNFTSLEPILSNGKKILIGDGSFSKVFLYQHKTSKIKYAIKRMNIPSYLKKTNNKNLILDEINIQSKIEHPNIIKLFNYFKDKNNINIFLILEYASKGTLFDYIQNKNGFDETEAFYFFFQAVNAIYFLHKNRIIHRDLKPENLLINHNNILKLCDFGWSVYLNNNKRITFCGTVEYMAPEIVKNESYDYSIDVWSLGVLLYELIHSHSPFVVRDLNINKIENNIVSKELRFKKGVSFECRDLIEKLLVKDAKNRMKIGEIYTHPFILKYINMITNYINIHQNTNYKKIPEEKDEDNEKTETTKREIFDGIRESFSEFDTIPNEPEPSKIIVNFDNIVRKFTKIDNNINKKRNENNMNKNKMLNVKSLKSLINKNQTQEVKYIKSLTLNNTFFQKLGINNSAKNMFNNNNDKFIMKKNLEEKENKNMNLNKENLMKLLIKKSKNDNPDLQIQLKKYTKNTLMEEYNNNLNKKYINKSKIINKNQNSKLKGNFSYSKNFLITSYISKNNKKLINKKLLENLTEKDINDKSKFNNSTILNLKNCKSISFFKNLKKNNISKETSDYSNSNSSRKINLKLMNNMNKKNILIKHIKTSNKKNNNKDLSGNIFKKPRSKEIFRNKFTLNLSNINVYNFCSTRAGLNNTKYFNHINTFVIMDKSRDLKMNKTEKNNLYKKSPKTARMEKKENSKLILSNNKSKKNNTLFNKTGIQNKVKQEINQKLLLNHSKSNKNVNVGKEKELSSRNANNKNDNTNNIFPSNSCN